MRIFVGTLKTIENEFDECVASIERQTHQNFEHFVFEDLPNKEAHDTLYRSFMERADEFDLMIKVDADMVIENKHLFAEIVERFQSNPKLKDLEMAVHDFFSDRLIWGMHAYRNTMRWEKSDEDLFVDRSSVEPEAHIHDDTDLAPAAIHCKDPSPFQAFHYGVHKATKIVQPGRWPKKQAYTQFHWKNVQETREHFRRTGDRRLGFAVLGAEFGLQNRVMPPMIDYSNPYLRSRFKEEFKGATRKQIEAHISKTAPYSVLPDRLRIPALLYRDRVQSLFS